MNEAELNRFNERAANSAQRYYQGVIDFIKWTSTLAAAAILWVGSSLGSTNGSALYLAVFSIVTLIICLVIAVKVIHLVLAAWAQEWVAYQEAQTLLFDDLMKSFGAGWVTEEIKKEHLDQFIQTTKASLRFRQPNFFNKWVVVHISLLTLGLIFYGLAKTLSST